MIPSTVRMQIANSLVEHVTMDVQVIKFLLEFSDTREETDVAGAEWLIENTQDNNLRRAISIVLNHVVYQRAKDKVLYEKFLDPIDHPEVGN